MTVLDTTKNRQKVIDILTNDCKDRFNDAQLHQIIQYLDNETDFFTAPASTRFHLCCLGGLCQHSLNVYHTLSNLVELYAEQYNISKSTIAIVALFHDLCKANFYKLDWKNVKIDGVWTKQQVYVIDDSLPLGHGEKSVIMLLSKMHINLSDDELYAIRWHMAGFDCAVKGGESAISNAGNKTPLVGLLQAADAISSMVLEINC